MELRVKRAVMRMDRTYGLPYLELWFEGHGEPALLDFNTQKLTLLSRGLVFLGGQFTEILEPIRFGDTVLRGFVDDEPVLQAYLRYQERVEDGSFEEGGEIPLKEIM